MAAIEADEQIDPLIKLSSGLAGQLRGTLQRILVPMIAQMALVPLIGSVWGYLAVLEQTLFMQPRQMST